MSRLQMPRPNHLQSSTARKATHRAAVPLFALLSTLLAVILAISGCSSGAPPPPGTSGNDRAPTPINRDAGTFVDAPCTTGDVSICSIELGTHDGQIDCAVGQKTCEATGKWGRCFPDASKGIKTV